MSPRRVLLVEVNEDGTTGGSHQALLDVARNLDRARWTPVVLFYQHNEFVGRLRALGIEVVTWDDVRAHEHRIRGRARPVQAAMTVAAVVRRARLLGGLRIDLVHLNNSPLFGHADWLPAARLLGRRCISHCRAELSPAGGFRRRLMSAFDRLIAISDHVAASMRAAGLPAARIARIDDGVDLGELQRRLRRSAASVRAELGVPEGGWLVVMAGHLRPWKGHDRVVAELARLAPAVRARLRVVFAGGEDPFAPEYRASLDALVRDAGLEHRVSFLGPREDVPDLMRAADVVLHATTIPEPFGLVVVEAMALGRPVVASRLGAPGEIVAPGTGWLFDPATPGELAALLGSLLAEPERRAAVADPARRRAAEFGVARMVRAVEGVYADALAPRYAGRSRPPTVAAAPSRAPRDAALEPSR